MNKWVCESPCSKNPGTSHGHMVIRFRGCFKKCSLNSVQGTFFEDATNFQRLQKLEDKLERKKEKDKIKTVATSDDSPLGIWNVEGFRGNEYAFMTCWQMVTPLRVSVRKKQKNER